MKNIFINKINVSNFGGVANGEYYFTPHFNIIEGASGTGKTTVYLAYLWALGFTVPTWEPQIDGYRLSKTKTEVVVELSVDGVIYTLSKTNSPKYKVNKFTAEEEYTGTDFKYIFDGQECGSYAEYKERVADLFGIDYFTLELLSNISLFNGEDNKRWNKEERRKYLFKLFDLENKIKELGNEKEFECLKEYIDKGKDELAINQILNTLKTDIENEVKSNQIIIEEKQKELAEYSYIDFEALQSKKEELSKEIERLALNEKEFAKNDILIDKKNELNKLRAELTRIQLKNDSVQSDWHKKVLALSSKVGGFDMDITFSESALEVLKNNFEDAKIELIEAEGEEFDNSKAICPTCKQKLPSDKIKELKTAFEKNKGIEIDKIKQKIDSYAEKVTAQTQKLNDLKEQKIANEGHLQELEENRPAVEDTEDLEKRINAIETEIKNADDININKEIKEKMSALKLEFENVVHELSKQEVLKSIRDRIEELKSRIKELGLQDSLRIEKKNALQKYTQRKVGMINEEINKNFEGVRYNFFKWNASSSSATKDYMEVANAVLAETGVEYDALSSGQKVKVNLYTNNSLRKILGVNIPQFVDDVVLSDLEKIKQDWQSVYLLTDNNKKPKLTLIKDCYTVDDCDVRGK